MHAIAWALIALIETPSPWLPSFALALIYCLPACLHLLSIIITYMPCYVMWWLVGDVIGGSGFAVRFPHEVDGRLVWWERWIPCGWWWLRSFGDIPCLDLFLWWYQPEWEDLPWRGALGAWSASDLVLMDMMVMTWQACGGGYYDRWATWYWWKVLALAN